MNEISVLHVNIENPQLKPLREKLSEHICCCYGMRSLHSKKVNSAKVKLMVLPDLVSALCAKLASFHLVPSFWVFWSRVRVLDYLASRYIAKDDSKILYTSSFYYKSIAAAKKTGKKIVINSGNSEPEREHNRIVDEYEKFAIKNHYIYGEEQFCKSRKKGLSLADYIVTISNVSKETYSRAGYDMSKFRLIPLTGTDFPRKELKDDDDKPKAFITTAFHSFIKGTHRLLLAWQKAGIKDIPLIVVGRLHEDMQEFIEKYGPFENVEFTGERHDLKEWYSTRDGVGVLLSLSEGAGRVTPEMMSFGYPMIVSPDATCDLVKNGYNGFVVETIDEKAIVEKLRYFAEDWNRVHALHENVISSVKTRTVRDFSLEVADFLNKLISDVKK